MTNNIISALHAIDVSTLNYGEWLAIGMALKEEGFSCTVWDEWSRNDKRYHAGECERKWNSFDGASKPVKGGTIIQMAKERGWKPAPSLEMPMDWNDVIKLGNVEYTTGAKELITFLEQIYDPEDYVGYVTNDAWKDKDGKWKPGKGTFHQTAGKIIALLKRYPGDMGAAIGDWKKQAGAWIHMNPLDGKGTSDKNVTKYRYALVESDDVPVAEQEKVFRELELPIATLVYSGGKSIHALVRIDAPNEDEYKKRVDYLYQYLEEKGISIDPQNRNPSRLTRMPGVTRNGKRQHLIATNIGKKSWTDWVDSLAEESKGLPPIVSLDTIRDNPPALPETVIEGILRRGHKMLIAGASKAGKSFLLMELCIAIAEGRSWLGFTCKQGRVLYINLEICAESAYDRFFRIYEAMGIPPDNVGNIKLWNLRGYACPLDVLAPSIISQVKAMGEPIDVIIVDPIYKVITGDENNASDMGKFCNQFDAIATDTGSCVIYCHHHSKGAQGSKRAMDRASGSGVFARDPDALLDLIQLELPGELVNQHGENVTAWRMESSLREFPNIQPVSFWFEHPIHKVDEEGVLKDLSAQGTWRSGKSKNSNPKMSADEQFRKVYDEHSKNGSVTVRDMMQYLHLGDKAIYSRVKKLQNEFSLDNGIIKRKV